MRRIVKPTTDISAFSAKVDVIDEVSPSSLGDISVVRLIDDGLLNIYREMRNITLLSAKGKLDAPTARDLRDYVKLLFELKERERESLLGLTDEELKAKAKAALAETEEKKDLE